MEKEKVISELKELIKENKEKIIPTKWYPKGVLGASYRVDGTIYAGWHTKTLSFLKMFLADQSDFTDKFIKCEDNTFNKAQAANSILESLIEYIEKDYINVESNCSIDSEIELARLFSRFHRVARQLRSRHDNRPTIDVEDEYDVQDLLHALLRIYFDDVRAEEWTPSYAGKSARMDFLLKNEKTVIEIKKTRQGLTDKEIGDQLIVDVERYKSHSDCKKLICFIYDPEGKVGNPDGLANDLMSQHKDFLTVIIEPSN